MIQSLILLLLLLTTLTRANAGMYYPPNKTLGGLWFFQAQECVTETELKKSGVWLLRDKKLEVSGNEFIVISRDVKSITQFDRYGSIRMSGELELTNNNKNLQLSIQFQKKNNPLHLGSSFDFESIDTTSIILVTESKTKCPHKIRLAFKRADNDNMHPGAREFFKKSRN